MRSELSCIESSILSLRSDVLKAIEELRGQGIIKSSQEADVRFEVTDENVKKVVDLLPEIEIKTPSKVLGNNTTNCMQSGVTYGVASQVDGMIDRIKEEINNQNVKVIATGGLSTLIVPLCKNEIELIEDLTLLGLFKIYSLNC